MLEDEREEKEQAVARTVAAEEALARAHEASGEERAALEADRDAAREHVERVEAELERLTHEKDAAEAALVAERLAHQVGGLSFPFLIFLSRFSNCREITQNRDRKTMKREQ